MAVFLKRVWVMVLVLALPAMALAQEGPQKESLLSFVAPESWRSDLQAGDERRLASFVEDKTASRIELLSKRVIREEHAPALFESFDKQLLTLGFNVITPSTDRSIDLLDGSSRNGQWSEYSFSTSDISVTIVTYAFTAQNVAYIAVGYFSRAEREKGIESFLSFLKSMEDRR